VSGNIYANNNYLVGGNNIYGLGTYLNIEAPYLRFRTDSNTDDVMRISSNGYVGIGTDSPESALHVTGQIQGAGSQGVHLGTNSQHSGIEVVSADSGNSYIDFSIPSVDYGARIVRDSNHNTLSITNNGGDNGWGSLHFLGTNIGINTASPASALHVAGGLTVNSDFSCQYTKITGRESQAYIGHSNFTEDIKYVNTGYTYQQNYAVMLNSAGDNKFNAKSGLHLCILGGTRLYINSNYVGIGTTAPSYTLDVNGHVGCYSVTQFSDDRLKSNEITITNALTSLMKLNPMTYDKYYNMDNSGNYTRESGFIAQDIWYQAPELRHIVSLGSEYNDVSSSTVPIPIDVSNNELLQDADYNNLGWSTTKPSGVKYTYLIAYLTKAIQELNIQRQEEKDALQASHDSLQASHDSLQASHDTLQASHDSLQTSHDSLKDELAELKTLLQSKGILDT
jgi:hypothetical protein